MADVSLPVQNSGANEIPGSVSSPAPYYDASKRVADVILAAIGGSILLLPACLIALVIRLTSKGPALHWSKRVGKNNTLFMMPKFRTMRVGTPQLATHLLQDPSAHLTLVGRLLRKTSLDELPQLYSILRGELSFVGPRPALFNQDDLVKLRTRHGVHLLVPGLSGWAQINGRDELSIPDKVALEREYLRRRSLLFDLKILVLTPIRAIFGVGVSH